MKTAARASLWLLLSSFLTIHVTVAAETAGNLRPEFELLWQEFRAVYPYHFQVIALSAPAGDLHRLLVISEPPPHVTVAGIRALNPVAFANLSETKNPIGFDGWVKDLLVDLPPLEEPDLRALLDSVSRYLYFTSYKSYVLKLPVNPPGKKVYNLDVKISAYDLNEALLRRQLKAKPQALAPALVIMMGLALAGLVFLYVLLLRNNSEIYRPSPLFLGFALLAVLLVATYWFRASGQPSDTVQHFVPVNGGPVLTVSELLDRGQAGVFLSVRQGLVLWSFARTSALAQRQTDFRQFALDSDLIVGAVRKGDQVVVVARERTVPVDILPPLRSETMLLLASVQTDELAQSYERTHILAGRIREESAGGPPSSRDWAPIYLSEPLIDSELGSLLNIADQLLKSWSMHGEVRYVRFNYPDPNPFPFPKALSEWVDATSLLFNWNTKGAGYIVDTGSYDIYALNRTGSLPIDYLAGDNSQLQAAEDRGYERFAGLSDPNLVRVVQYAALYQVFRNFDVAADQSKRSSQRPDSTRVRGGVAQSSVLDHVAK